jgi:hypothetical protein
MMKIDSISASRISTDDLCDFKYYLTYELDLGDQLFKSKMAAGFGSSIHGVLEHIARVGIITQEEWEKVLLEQMVKHKIFAGIEHANKAIRGAYFVDRDCRSCRFYRDGVCAIQNQLISEFEGCPLSVWHEA